MSRLTKRNEKGVAYMAISETLSKRDQQLEGSKPILEGIYAIFQRLASYEDTGLRPEDFLILENEAEAYKEEYLKYKTLEEQGLLIELPCKVGDIVYKVNKTKKNIKEHEIIKIDYSTIDNQHFTMEFIFKDYDSCFYHHFGKTVFLTREEAKKALEVENE